MRNSTEEKTKYVFFSTFYRVSAAGDYDTALGFIRIIMVCLDLVPSESARLARTPSPFCS